MVSALDSGSSGPGRVLSGDIDNVLCSWARHLTIKVPFSTQVFPMGTGEMLGVTLRWTSIPSRGE